MWCGHCAMSKWRGLMGGYSVINLTCTCTSVHIYMYMHTCWFNDSISFNKTKISNFERFFSSTSKEDV